MRVIAGLYRSRPLTAPKGLTTRPTYDRLRETLFNVLAPRLPDAVFVDLYAGSGANGIEALSRGSRFVYFVENGEPALQAIRANLASLGIKGTYGLEPRTASAFLRRAAANALKTGQTFDILFLDPPYDSLTEYASTLTLLGGEAARVLNENSVVVAEHQRRQPLEESYGKLRRYRVLEQRDSALSFFAPEGAGEG
ncbi:MAG TPA: 16S rRNA (guanine(966)-N(2))-methyltransferase RsmD [Acidisarcina sp.]|nr:16S rRNA (guanine(966)-N(2))-methyltransferase RsmD [Acidisarcina sp.]